MILCNFTYLLINYPTGVYDSCWFIFSRRRYVFAKGPLTYWTRNLSFLYVVFQWNWIFLDFGSLLSSPCPCHFLITILCKGIFKYSQILSSNEFFILNRNNLTHKKLKRIILLPFPHVLRSTGIKTWHLNGYSIFPDLECHFLALFLWSTVAFSLFGAHLLIQGFVFTATLLLAITQVRRSARESGMSFREYGRMLFFLLTLYVKPGIYWLFQHLFLAVTTWWDLLNSSSFPNWSLESTWSKLFLLNTHI